ncbi:hypothetical protein [Sphingobacterium sp. ML3W]|uniref:hypothetical protein n=1 Tax=Sphingobacterium sp. ML3W TaxID=1538644 RepID=UPI00068E8864|nr:hypothetical protein [Sphingobacterium sp. ML3W]
MMTFRMDRTAFKAQSAVEAANHAQYYIKLSWQQRLQIAFYLNSIAFNFSLDNPPRMDKTRFKATSRT